MSEKPKLTHEHESRQEKIKRSTPEVASSKEDQAEKHRSQTERTDEARKELESIQDSLENQRPSKVEVGQDQADQQIKITKDDKHRAYKHTMSQVRGKLSKPSKSFSRVIHNPGVEKASEVMEKTVARPSAMLGAALVATVGLAIMSFFARRNGFSLSGSELMLFVAAGWLAGLTIEFVWRKLIRRS